MSTRKHHRGRRRKKKNNFLWNIILVIAIIVFCVSGFQLFKIGKGYKDGQDEYNDIRNLAVTEEKSTDGKEDNFHVDFDKLKKINPDTIGWIRFWPEPKEINYPIVQGTDNQTYLHKTFSDNDNTLGTIFIDANASADLSDRNSIIYGHRMKDGSMFRHLQDYDEKSFWKKNPHFYIYTVDGRKLTYEIFASGVTTESSDVYRTDFADDTDFDAFVNAAKSIAAYDTGVEVNENDTCVTLSTCTGASDEHRIVVIGKKIKEEGM